MKRLPLVILLFVVVLVAMVTGCGGAARYDGRLVAVDSLMHDYPDSALAMVEVLSDTALAAEGDRAYRALLLTQARYKAYVTATSDSDINRALYYYLRHSREREKLTRAYLYKGAVMEELGHPDSAMLYYKHAEATADEKDYVNLGQINTRIASLYRLYYGDAQICYDKYKQALKYHRLTNNKRLQYNCLLCMGAYSGITGIDNAKNLLTQAQQLAEEMADTSKIIKVQELLCRQLLTKDTTLLQAKQIALLCWNHYKPFINNDLLLDLADIYSRMGMLDSARYFIDLLDDNPQNVNIGQILFRKYSILSVMAEYESDVVRSDYYNKSVRKIQDSIDNNHEKYLIQKIENEGNLSQVESRKKEIKGLQLFLILLGGLLAAYLLFSLAHILKRELYIRSIHRELENHKTQTAVINHEELLRELDTKDSAIEGFVQNMVALIHTSLDSTEKDPPSVIRKRIRECIADISSDSFWQELRKYLDKKYDNLITKIAAYPKINENDLRFIELCCCKFDYLEIAIMLGYTPNYISQKRKDTARKLKLKVPLQDFLDSCMENGFPIQKPLLSRKRVKN